MTGRALLGAALSACLTATTLASAAAADTAGAGASGIGDAYFPAAGNGGYDVDHYDIELRYHPRSPEIDATVEIEATASMDLASFDLDLVGLEVQAVTVDGLPASMSRTDTDLTVTPEAPIDDGARFSVVVEYGGEPSPGTLASTPLQNGWIRLPSGATYVLGQPDGARTWFPSNDHPSDKATFTFSVAVPDGVEAVANGTLASSTVDAEGWRTWQWKMEDPMATYLATVVVGDFEEQLTASPDGVPIRNFFLAAEYEQAVSDFAVTGEMIDHFADLFGPYPFAEYGAVTVPTMLRTALETQTRSVFGSDSVDGTGASQAIIAHELAHQWFGDAVTPRLWRDVWLSEGFATYAESLWREHAEPGFDIDAAMSEVATRFGTQLWPIDDPGVDHLFGLSVYQRGALTLHALRRTVGDEAFFEILRSWSGEYRHANATSAEFIDLAERVSGQQLDRLFEAWLEEADIPALPGAKA